VRWIVRTYVRNKSCYIQILFQTRDLVIHGGTHTHTLFVRRELQISSFNYIWNCTESSVISTGKHSRWKFQNITSCLLDRAINNSSLKLHKLWCISRLTRCRLKRVQGELKLLQAAEENVPISLHMDWNVLNLYSLNSVYIRVKAASKPTMRTKCHMDSLP
jgi:hypothetical protein